MKEKLMELEQLMREVKTKMSELDKIGFHICAVYVDTLGSSVHFYNGLLDVLEELEIAPEYDDEPVAGWKRIKTGHDDIMLEQYERNDEPFKRRAQ